MKFRSNSIYILLILSVLLAIASAFITYYNTKEKEQSIHTVIRRYKSIASSEQLLSLLKDMETGQRGYIISGDSDFLEPYNEAKVKITTTTNRLISLVNDNEEQSNLINGKIIGAIQNKSEDLENVIKLANTNGKDSAARRITTKIGKAYMDTIHILIQDLIQRENELLDIQNQKLEKNTLIEDSVRFIAFALIAITSLAAINRLLQKRRHINELVAGLQNANETLERKVEERTSELVEANKAKDHFLSIASHDLKVPIAGVLGLIGLMKVDMFSRSASDTEYLAYMEDSCNNMQRLITNLLDINRIEQGQTTIKKQVVDVDQLLQKIRNVFIQQAQKKLIKLDIKSLEGTVHTDPDALQRILENLLSNAIKFSPRDKTIRLLTSRSIGEIQFDIVDQGPGIPHEEMRDLFEKFNRLSNKPTDGEGSTGLGLSIVKELVKLIDGEIFVQSSLSEGSIFSIRLRQEV